MEEDVKSQVQCCAKHLLSDGVSGGQRLIDFHQRTGGSRSEMLSCYS